MGPAKECLGIKITTTEHGFLLNQPHIVQKILTNYDFTNVKPKFTPMVSTPQLEHPTTLNAEETKLYRSTTGLLNWLVSCTRPDLTTCSSILGQYNNNPNPACIAAIKRVLRYLSNTKTDGIYIES